MSKLQAGLIGLSIGILIAILVPDMSFSSLPSEVADANSPASVALSEWLPSQSDIQIELNRRNPKTKLYVDGFCGTLTRDKWDLAYNQQCAEDTCNFIRKEN